jgi:hypothetical protein
MKIIPVIESANHGPAMDCKPNKRKSPNAIYSRMPIARYSIKDVMMVVDETTGTGNNLTGPTISTNIGSNAASNNPIPNTVRNLENIFRMFFLLIITHSSI